MNGKKRPETTVSDDDGKRNLSCDGKGFERSKQTVVDYMEMYYDPSRLHSGINYNILNDFFTLQCLRFSR